jgi:hypothetical protein
MPRPVRLPPVAVDKAKVAWGKAETKAKTTVSCILNIESMDWAMYFEI